MQIPQYRCRRDNPLIAAGASGYEPEDRSSGKLAGWLDALSLAKGGNVSVIVGAASHGHRQA